MSTPKLTGGRRIAAVLVGIGLLAIFASSFAYRLSNPSLQKVRRQAPAQGQMPGAMQGGDMSAIGELMRQMQENPDDADLLIKLGEQFMKMEAWDRAEMFLSRAVAADPANTHAMHVLGASLFQQEKFGEAEEIYLAITELEPQNPHPRFNLGMLYKHYLNRPDDAQSQFRFVAESDEAPDNLKAAALKELETVKEHGDN